MPSYKVLVVDDDPDDLDMLRDALEKEGMTPVLTLSSALEVLNYLQGIEHREDLPSLIITDLSMPESWMDVIC